MALVLDTGPLLAALDAADPDHAVCARLLTGAREDLVVPSLVLAELDYWCHERLGGDVWLAFLEDVLDGAYRVEHRFRTTCGGVVPSRPATPTSRSAWSTRA